MRPRGGDPFWTFSWGFENQPLASEILTQPRSYKRAKSNLLEQQKRSQPLELGSCLGYTSIYSFSLSSIFPKVEV